MSSAHILRDMPIHYLLSFFAGKSGLPDLLSIVLLLCALSLMEKGHPGPSWASVTDSYIILLSSQYPLKV